MHACLSALTFFSPSLFLACSLSLSLSVSLSFLSLMSWSVCPRPPCKFLFTLIVENQNWVYTPHSGTWLLTAHQGLVLGGLWFFRKINFLCVGSCGPKSGPSKLGEGGAIPSYAHGWKAQHDRQHWKTNRKIQGLCVPTEHTERTGVSSRVYPFVTTMMRAKHGQDTD